LAAEGLQLEDGGPFPTGEPTSFLVYPEGRATPEIEVELVVPPTVIPGSVRDLVEIKVYDDELVVLGTAGPDGKSTYPFASSRSDPTPEEETPERAPMRLHRWGQDLTGTEGWDSSDFPDQVPLDPPAGSRLLEIRDGPADGQGRYWTHVIPQGMTPQAACKIMLANTGGLELYQQEDPCEPANEAFYLFKLRGDDRPGSVSVVAMQAEVPCPDGTFECSVLEITIIDFGWSSRR